MSSCEMFNTVQNILVMVLQGRSMSLDGIYSQYSNIKYKNLELQNEVKHFLVSKKVLESE